MSTCCKTVGAGLVALSLWVAGIVPAAGAEVQKHSGTVVAKEPGVMRLAEIGPWQVKEGETVITYRTITVTPSTKFALAWRDEGAASGFPGDWVEEAVEPWDLLEGDFVTVECLHERGGLFALKITVVEMAEP